MCVQEEKFQVGFSCTQTLIHNNKKKTTKLIRFMLVCRPLYIQTNIYTYIHDFIYPYSDRQKAEKIHNNANMRNRHTVNGIEENVKEAEVEPTKNMITQRRQANNTQVSPSTSLSLPVCVNMVYICTCVCVCGCVREYSRGARTSERTTENMTTSAKKKKML